MAGGVTELMLTQWHEDKFLPLLEIEHRTSNP
jgi:hypothetical protein